MAKPSYSKKPLSEQELAKRGGFKTTHAFREHRKGGNPFGHPKDWKPKKASK